MELAIDTASERSGVALAQQGELVSELVWRCRANQSVELLPAIEHLLQRAVVALSELELISVCRGPGAYGGLRAGLSTAMGLAFARGIAVLGIGRLEIDAYQHAAYPGPVVAVHLAGRGELAWATYEQMTEGWTEITPPHLSWSDALLDEAPVGALFCGEVDEALTRSLRDARGVGVALALGEASVRRPGALAELAWRRYLTGARDSALAIEPLYLREPQITVSRKQPGLIRDDVTPSNH